MGTWAWIVTPEAPEEFLEELESLQEMSDIDRARFIVEAYKKGWLKFLGATDGSPTDVANDIRAHFGEQKEETKRLRLKEGPTDGA